MFFRKKTQSVSWIAIFLGNPGARYDNTRHNAGFMACDKTAEKTGVKVNRIKFNALISTANIGGESVLLMKPQTYMNLSGGALWQAMKFYKVPLERVVAVTDDVSLPPGKIRVRRRGSAGGHNGLKDIISKCGGEDFPRIKIGVGSPPHESYDMADWVLAKLSGNDKKLIDAGTKQASDALEMIITKDVDEAMAKFN